MRPRSNAIDLPGKPDFVFRRAKVVIFCDADFWHGCNFGQRKKRLKKGHNAPYWVAKIESNMKRDVRQAKELRAPGWRVLRFWEHDILADPAKVAARIKRVVTAALSAVAHLPSSRSL